ncbi:hypothetical protein COJ96_02060 [Bacillus sp. AFS073361]|uniref:MotE family protein n=1 Tax=Bacillus sp. AFS073361 TaxID=2033511 RepID=UPI000BF6E3A3|nr:hypothetical protein [Bacillus sp. AFS073361]PFP30770.1 hypothetical protein COJ96_02060 [Bacillus sp. AFS073361]
MEEKHQGKLENFFYLVFFPLLFTVIFAAVVLNFLGIPVWKTGQDWGNKLPVLNHVIPGPALVKETDYSDEWEEKYLKSRTELKEKNQKIKELHHQLSSTQKGLKDLELSFEQLQRQLETNQTQDFKDQMKTVAGIYENLPPSKAAAMLESMPLEDASLTISLLDRDLQSSILGSMKDAGKAGQMMIIIKEISILKATDQNALKKKIHEIVQSQENPTETLSETISGMPAVQSAGMVVSMMGTNSQVAINLMKNINTNNRSQILTEIAKKNAKLAAQITASLNN